jgi:TctA family transporter
MTNPENGKPGAPLNRPLHPWLVLAIALVLPGVGQVVNNTPMRGLIMLFFMGLLGLFTFLTTTPEHSFLGRYAGGLFVYAISVMDAYRWARYRWEYFARNRDAS